MAKKKNSKNTTIPEEKKNKQEEDFVRKIENKDTKDKKKKNTIINILVILTIVSCLGFFGGTILNGVNLKDIVLALLLLLFTVFFVSVSVTNPSKKKGSNILALIVLIIYQAFGCLVMFNIIKMPTIKVMENLVDKSLSSAVKWTTDNKIDLEQIYEYSDVVSEYHVIYQNVKPGTKLKNVKKLILTISEGPNPSKEIIIPSMIGWESETVLKYIEDNHLTNIKVEFVKSTSKANTLIEQSKSGNVRRNEEIKFVFSYGEERDFSEIKLSNLTNKSKYEAMFYLAKNGIKYEFVYDFSDSIKKDNVISQNIEPGTMISLTGENVVTVKVTISKGPKIIVPDLKAMSVEDVTSWIIKNKLKVEFKDAYDENIAENKIISASHNKGDAVSEGTVITITISNGKLRMPSLKSLSEFREWATKYNINYDEQHEFSDSVAIGDVIRYSYKKGDTIKNNDTIIVTISDGKKISVPSVIGLTKSAAEAKLKSAGLNYNFVYRYNSNVEKGKVSNQSISGGSTVSAGTTVTVTISNGKAPSNNGNAGNSGGTTPTPKPSCENIRFFIQDGNTGSQVLSATRSANPKFNITATFVDSCSNGDSVSGSVCNASSYDDKKLSTCNKINLIIVK